MKNVESKEAFDKFYAAEQDSEKNHSTAFGAALAETARRLHAKTWDAAVQWLTAHEYSK